MGTVASRGRWVWGLSGMAVIAAITLPAGALVIRAGRETGDAQYVVPTRTIVVTQSITSLDVESYGADISVVAAPVRYTQVIEAISFDTQSGAPAVTHSVTRGRLTLAAPECDFSDCSVGFTVTVPEGVAVTAHAGGGQITVSGVASANLDSGGAPVRVSNVRGTVTADSEGAPVIVSGVGGANLDSGDGPVSATNVRGPLVVNSEGGALGLNGLSGSLDADTGGGPVLARDVAASTVTVNTEGGNADLGFTTGPQVVTVDTGGGDAQLGFAAAPHNVSVSTEDGSALIAVPGGPYAVTTNSGGGPASVGIAINPAASRFISVDTGGGSLLIVPGTGSKLPFAVSGPPPLPKAPPAPKLPGASAAPNGAKVSSAVPDPG